MLEDHEWKRRCVGMTEKLMAFYLPEEIHTLIKKLAVMDHKTLKQYLREIVLVHAKDHGDGNPGFTMDQFIEEPEMKAVPAFFRNRDDWLDYIEKLSEKDAKELLCQAQTINSMADKKVNYGSATASIQ